MSKCLEATTYNIPASLPETVFYYYLKQIDNSIVREYATPELRKGKGRSSIDMYSVDKNIAFEVDIATKYHEGSTGNRRDNKKTKILSDCGIKVVRFRNEACKSLRKYKNLTVVEIPDIVPNLENYFKCVQSASKFLEEIYGVKLDINYARDCEKVEALHEELNNAYKQQKSSPVVKSSTDTKQDNNPQMCDFYGRKVSPETYKILKRLDAQKCVFGLNGESFADYKAMAFAYNLNYLDFIIEFASGNKRLCAFLREKGVEKRYKTELGFFKTLEDVAIVYGVDEVFIKKLINMGETLDSALQIATKPVLNEKCYDLSIYDVPEEERSTFIRTDLQGNVYTTVNVLCRRHGVNVCTYKRRVSSGLKKSQCLSKF